jgi:hypothetical protein
VPSTGATGSDSTNERPSRGTPVVRGVMLNTSGMGLRQLRADARNVSYTSSTGRWRRSMLAGSMNETNRGRELGCTSLSDRPHCEATSEIFTLRYHIGSTCTGGDLRERSFGPALLRAWASW